MVETAIVSDGDEPEKGQEKYVRNDGIVFGQLVVIILYAQHLGVLPAFEGKEESYSYVTSLGSKNPAKH